MNELAPELTTPIMAQINEGIKATVDAEQLFLTERANLLSLITNAAPDSLTLADLWNVYWFAQIPGVVPAIGSYLGVAVNQVAARLGPGPSMSCQLCGKQAYPPSLAHVREGRVILCSDCESSKDERRREEMESRVESYERAKAAQRQRLHDLRTMPYQEYLRTPEWQQTRTAALKRAAYSCQLCNGQGLLDVHHRTYERRGNELVRDVIVLCHPCHAKHHGKEGLS